MANALNEMIADSSQVFVMGHKHADPRRHRLRRRHMLHGAQKRQEIPHRGRSGEKRRKSLINMLREEPEYREAFITPQKAILSADGRCLLVVVDTNRPEQVEDENLLLTCNRVGRHRPPPPRRDLHRKPGAHALRALRLVRVRARGRAAAGGPSSRRTYSTARPRP